MTLKKTLFSLFIALALLQSGTGIANSVVHSSSGTNSLVITMPDNDGPLVDYVRHTFAEISKRTGIPSHIKTLPKLRALVSANEGRFDGVGARIEGIENQFKNLRKVQVAIFREQHIVFAKHPSIVNNVKDLPSLIDHAGTNQYQVAYLLGSKKAEMELSPLAANLRTTYQQPEKIFSLIAMNRLGAYVGGPAMSNRIILKEKFATSGIKEVAIASEFDLYPYLHKKHTRHIPSIEQALTSLVADGTLNRIRERLE
ncbi:MAG: transporter substrate-binding domain-containing protein, partial [Pseudomonadales bacterium]|nr:transporter substrate-binding domain-containing protein [Pseudomonadales bacterium]